MAIRAFIVDDEKENIEILNYFLERFCTDIKVVGVARSIKETMKLLDETIPDVIFLDIELGNSETAFDLLELIKDLETQVVIVTAYREFGYEAIKFNVTEYILKPISVKDLQNAVEKVKKKANYIATYEDETMLESRDHKDSKSNAGLVAISTNNEIELIPIDTIISLKADGKYTVFNLLDEKKIISSKNILEYQRLLPAHSFFRIHHSYLVNLTKIKKINKTDGWLCIMTDGSAVPVSRRRREEFLSRIAF